MFLDRGEGNHQSVSDLSIAGTSRKELQDLLLAPSERLNSVFGRMMFCGKLFSGMVGMPSVCGPSSCSKAESTCEIYPLGRAAALSSE